MSEAGSVSPLMRWGPAVLGLACLVSAAALDGRAPADGTASDVSVGASDQAHALLGGLQVDERVAGWTVLGIEGARADAAKPGWIRVDFGRDGLRFSVTVAPLGARPQGAPRTTERYALYYGHPHPRGAKIPEGATRAILAEIERRVRASEATVRVPGMDAQDGSPP